MDNPNLYFFRDFEGYSPNEMEKRLHVDDIRDAPDPVSDILEDAGLEQSLLEKEKSEIFYQLNSHTESERYERFLRELWNERGQEGDKANLQFYQIESDLGEELINHIEEGNGSETTDRLLDSISYFRRKDLDRENLSIHSESDQEFTDGGTDDDPKDFAVDIQFQLIDIEESFDSENIELIGTGETNIVAFDELRQLLEQEGILEEIGIDRINALRQTNELEVEARYYNKSGILFVSNRDIWDKLQTDIRDRINEWGGSMASTGNPQLRETDLLYIQNVMEGDNSGLDYDNFHMDNRLNTAKYRGPRRESMTRSPVLTPAKEQGEITQVRFYYAYDNWEVQVRLHSDGHITTTMPTKPDFASMLERNLEKINLNDDFLTPIDERISAFARAKQRAETRFNERSYRSTRKAAFGSLVEKYIRDDLYEESEEEVYAAIICSICLRFGQLDLDASRYPNPNEIDDDDYPEDYRELASFIEDYFSYELVAAPPDFEQILEHLNHVFTVSFVQNQRDPTKLIDAVQGTYDL